MCLFSCAFSWPAGGELLCGDVQAGSAGGVSLCGIRCVERTNGRGGACHNTRIYHDFGNFFQGVSKITNGKKMSWHLGPLQNVIITVTGLILRCLNVTIFSWIAQTSHPLPSYVINLSITLLEGVVYDTLITYFPCASYLN